MKAVVAAFNQDCTTSPINGFAALVAAPVCVDDEGVVEVELHGGEDVLLGALVLHVVVESPCEGDLRVVVDVAAHLQYSTVQYSTVQCSTAPMLQWSGSTLR